MPGHGRGLRRLIPSFAAAATIYAAATALGWPASAVPIESGDQAIPCRSEQVAVNASPAEGAVGHRALTLMFSLAGGAEPCTLTGYAGVDSGAGGPLIHARPTLRGYMGGLPDGVDVPPAVLLSISTQGQAIVEGMAVDADGVPCPTYTELSVNPPDTEIVLTVAATIDACALQVHPITAV
ncbi:DUF4232 domain-containing protein [Mycobacterium mantenii]|uniref:DUF4232 domain-containing protein n=1 Tax=Mycobacterium mantenii TaxID=560555 RepID=UPI0009EF0E59